MVTNMRQVFTNTYIITLFLLFYCIFFVGFNFDTVAHTWLCLCVCVCTSSHECFFFTIYYLWFRIIPILYILYYDYAFTVVKTESLVNPGAEWWKYEEKTKTKKRVRAVFLYSRGTTVTLRKCNINKSILIKNTNRVRAWLRGIPWKISGRMRCKGERGIEFAKRWGKRVVGKVKLGERKNFRADV